MTFDPFAGANAADDVDDFDRYGRGPEFDAVQDHERNRAAVAALFRHFPALGEIKNRDLVEIIEEAVAVDFDPEQRILYTQGDPIRYLFLIDEGQVEEQEINPPDAPDQNTMKRVVNPGKLLGLYDLFYGEEHSTRARRLSGAVVFPLRAVAMERLIYRFPSLRSVFAPLSIIARLRTMPLLARVNPVALGFVADACEPVRWSANELLYDVDEAAEWIYFIDQGQVRLEWAAQEPDSLLGNGGTFGFVDEGDDHSPQPTHSHAAISTIPTTGYRIGRGALDDIVNFRVDERCRRQRRAVAYTLNNLPLLRNFSPTQKRKLAGFVSHYVIPNNHIIMQQGEMNDSLWVLMPRQRARIHALDEHGQAMQSTGTEGINYFGEAALRVQVPVDSTIEAEAGSQWLRLHHDDLDAFSSGEEQDMVAELALRVDQRSLPRHVTPRSHHLDLQAGEFIDTFRQHHWIVLLRKTWPGLMLLCLIFLPGTFFAIFAATPPGIWWTVLMLAVGLVTAAQLAWGVIDYMNDYLIVTNRRVVRQDEVIFLKQWRQEAALEQIQNVDVMTTFWGNVLRYGKLVIRTAGTDGAIPFFYVGEPEEVRAAIFRLRSRRQAHVMAEGKEMIQRMLENRLGLQLQLPATVYRKPTPSPRRKRLPEWLRNFLGRMVGERRGLQGPPGDNDHIIWRKHWFILVRNLLPTLGIFSVIALLLFGQLFAWMEDLRQAFLAIDLLLVPIGLANLGWAIWITADWRNDTYEISGEHVVDVEKKPLFFAESRRTARLTEIENVEINIPSPVHYILNFGNVRLQTAATEGDFTFDWVPDPRSVAAEVQRRIELSLQREAEMRTRQRARELPDWFEMYSRLGGEQTP